MAKNKVSEWSSTPGNNTDIASIDIAEGCAPSGINNAIREVMAQIKDMQTGADSDNFVVGGNLSVTGTTTATGAITANGGVVGNLTGNVTGNVTGNASTATALSGTLAIAGGGTGQTTASAAFDALKQAATESATGVVEKATTAEAQAFTSDKFIDGERLKDAFNATGTAPFYACRAWVNFDATKNAAGATDSSNTARFLKGSGNITSVVKNGTGDYTVTFATEMPDANYSVSGICNPVSSSGNGNVMKHFDYAYTSSAARIRTINPGVGFYDSSEVNIAVFR